VNPSTKLLIPRAIHDAMIAHALAERPIECCGLLVGPPLNDREDYCIVELMPLVNALVSPTEFESEPRGLLAAHRTMRDKGWEILAVYHSHPNSPAVPSHKDREMWYSDQIATVIVSLQLEPEVRAWWIDGEAPITIV
jgi:proteasome lid subunit RPN8/RPN11